MSANLRSGSRRAGARRRAGAVACVAITVWWTATASAQLDPLLFAKRVPPTVIIVVDTSMRMLEDGAECEDALTQLAAVNKAISRGGYALVATGLQHCLTHGGPDTVDAKKMEKLFLSLA